MAPAFDDPAVLDDEDRVGRAHRGQSVSDHDRGPTRQRLGERLLHRRLRLGVQRGGGLIEHHDAGPPEQQARDGQPLALAAPDSR